MSESFDARVTKSQEPVDSPQSLPQASTMPASNPQESLTGLGHATLSMPSHPFAGERPSDSQASPAADVDLTQINEGQASSRQLPPYIGRFRVEHEIGSGGMGAVFRVCDPVLNRPLAVKVLLEKHKHNAHLQSRFQEEAQILGQLQHPGVPPLYDVGRLENGLPFLAMKLVKGRTLAALLADRTSSADDLPRFLAIFETVCQTIAFVHARNVIHRDLKPSNIMVGEFGEVQVMDWGLAKVLRRLEDESAERPASGDLFEQFGAIATIRTEEHGQSTQVGSVVGTFAYMAPEQARGEIDRLDERCDVFSLGALLSLILTAKPPYTAKNQEELARQSFEGDLTEALLRLEKCGADAELVTLAKACLAVRLEERPSNAAAVSERVAAYRRAVEARLRQAEVERAAAFAKRIEARKRRRLIVALAFIVGLFLLVAGAVAWRQRQVENDRTQAVESDLEETGRHRDAGRWPAARLALERAEGRLGDAGPKELRRRLEQMRGDLNVVAALEEARMLMPAVGNKGDWEHAAFSDAFRKAFWDYGLDVDSMDLDEAAKGISRSAVREALVAGLDFWNMVWPEKDPEGRERLWKLATRVDKDEWKRRLRAAVDRRDRAALLALAHEKPVAELAPVALEILSRALQAIGTTADAVAVLKEGQVRYPDEFWINYQLGQLLRDSPPRHSEEALGYLRVAVALRPDNSRTHYDLGFVLEDLQRPREAEAEFREAIRLDENFATGHYQLGLFLFNEGRPTEALTPLRRGHELGAKNPEWRLPSAELIAMCENYVALDTKLAMISRGEEKPTNAAELLALFEMCLSYKKHYVAAVRLFADALNADPKLNETSQDGQRYKAACAAVKAASGKGHDVAGLQQEEIAYLRRQALAWLNADLAVWTKLAQESPNSIPEIKQTLERWKFDPDLAGVRDKSALAPMDDGERESWTELWMKIDKLLQDVAQAEKKKSDR